MNWRLPFLCVSLTCALARAAEPPRIDFSRDIQPILSDNCYFCHGPDGNKRKGDLRLDTLDPKLGPFAPRDGYEILSPGKIDDSVLILRITSDDPEFHMPPPKANRHLTDEQIAKLTKWVEQGAKWGKHWSFVPPVRAALPDVSDAKWCRNEIDRFILSRLDREGLKPLPEAPKETLIRRVTLDLTGLPPTTEEVDAFLADKSPDAYEKVVDRLLASPRYGERQVWEWLAASRYADTNGYQADPTRTMWPWRDWVIKAINENLSYDKFATWQLAGDLLPNATQEQRLASAFNRNHPFNGEGGRIPEETRVENVMDRTDTTATIFLGMTVGCAKCHDHKYDPIKQKEYYGLSAYFNQSSETGKFEYVNGGNVLPVMDVITSEQEAKRATLKTALKEANAKLAATTQAVDAKEPEWEKSLSTEKGWQAIKPSAAYSREGASMQVLDADSSVLVSGKSPDNDVHEVVLHTDLAQVNAIKLEALPDVSLPLGGPGRSTDSGNFVLTNLTGEAIGADGKSVKLTFAYADATYSQEGTPASAIFDKNPNKTGWAVLKAPDKNNLSVILGFAESIAAKEIRLHFVYAWPYNKQHTMGRFRLSATSGSPITPGVAAALAVAADKRDEAQKNLIRDFYRTRVSKDYKALADASAEAKQALDAFEGSINKVMVMNDASPRKTFVLTKGSYDKQTAEVPPGVPGVLNPLPKAEKNDRLALAKWFFDDVNPLTARVTVNRMWQQFFGIGIVKTVDDFGMQGERPVHPELLDWLAVEFRERGWDMKHMVRLIVTSSTYRQSSKSTPALLEKDPENRLLARGARFRLPAIVIRDEALAASGLLVEKVGGAPVKPYQPPGIWEEATFGFIKYEQDHGESLYRRSLYTFWRRIVGPTQFFDEPARSVCTVRPSRTNSPLHAFTTLNDTTFIEAARGLAQRIMLGASTDETRLELAYRIVLARNPAAKEQTVLLEGLKRLKAQFTSDPAAATKLLAVGESKRDEKLNPIDHAAYTGVCLTILNLDEALNKE